MYHFKYCVTTMNSQSIDTTDISQYDTEPLCSHLLHEE